MQIRSTLQVGKKQTNVAWLGQAQRSLVFNITEHRNTVTVLFMWQLINVMQLDIITRWYTLYVCGRQAASIIAYKLYIIIIVLHVQDVIWRAGRHFLSKFALSSLLLQSCRQNTMLLCFYYAGAHWYAKPYITISARPDAHGKDNQGFPLNYYPSYCDVCDRVGLSWHWFCLPFST